MLCDAMRCDAMRCDAMLCYAMPCYAMLCSPKGGAGKGKGGMSKRAKDRLSVVLEVIGYIVILAALAYLTAETIPGDHGNW